MGLNKLANSWTAEPPFVQAHAQAARSRRERRTWWRKMVRSFCSIISFHTTGVQSGSEFFQTRHLLRSNCAAGFEPFKGGGRFVIDAPFAAAFDLSAQVFHYRTEEIAKPAPLFAVEGIE